MIEAIKWQAMTPEQRDELVAEKIFGWQRVMCDGDEKHVELPDNGMAICTVCGSDAFGWAEDIEHGIIPLKERYTTSMDAAWKVVQRLWELHTPENAYERESVFLGYLGGLVSFEDGMTAVRFTLADLASTSPEDICIAALKACGYKVQYEPLQG